MKYLWRLFGRLIGHVPGLKSVSKYIQLVSGADFIAATEVVPNG